jgi:hypothetical protein
LMAQRDAEMLDAEAHEDLFRLTQHVEASEWRGSRRYRSSLPVAV